MKSTIKSRVAANIESLKTMNHGQLFAWTRDNGMAGRAGFSAFKKALLEHGVDYDALRAEHRERKADALEAKVGAEIVLFSDAKARCNRFAICDEKSRPVWYGRFFENDPDYDGEQSSGELSAAKKAIWLAARVRETICVDAIRLTLKVDAQWLCSLSGKAKALADVAERSNVVLEMAWIAGATNPADRWTTASGFQSWKNANLAGLTREAIAAEPPPAPAVARIPPPAVSTAPIETPPSRSGRGPEYEEWFAVHAEQWPGIRDAWKAQGISSRERDLKLREAVETWVAAGKPKPEQNHV